MNKLLQGIFTIIFAMGCILLYEIILMRKELDISKTQITDITTEYNQLLDSINERTNRISDMQETLIRSYDLDSIRSYYYSVIFNDYAEKYSMPWSLFAAVVRMESNFVSTAKSHRNCKGLMQLSENTMKELCVQLGVRYRENITIWDDVINLIGGMTYLHNTHKDKGIEEAVKVYLGGPDYLRVIKVNKSANQYVAEYSSSIRREFGRLNMSYDGIRSRRLSLAQ